MINLTKKQQAVLDFIISFKAEHEYTPTYHEMSKHFRITQCAIRAHIQVLQHKGYVEKPKGKLRAIKIIERPYVVIDGRKIEIGIPGTNITRVK